jgi:hypothetical protein
MKCHFGSITLPCGNFPRRFLYIKEYNSYFHICESHFQIYMESGLSEYEGGSEVSEEEYKTIVTIYE